MKKTIVLGLAAMTASAMLATSPISAWAEDPGSSTAGSSTTSTETPTTTAATVPDGVKTITDHILKTDSTPHAPGFRSYYNMFVVGLRGQATVRDKGPVFIDYTWQRGTITAKTPTSVTITSKDGFLQTWTMHETTRYRRLGKPADLSKLLVGDGVFAIGVPGAVGPTAAAVFVPRNRGMLEAPSVPSS
ncbi:hypothetical protein [Streptosporangium sp. NPDC000396]|uniref:hypothetical protein n=1 Tax=Streptosporangium sp. NPDC000396 TaxID=3366185 RepID=UPI0036ABA7CA